jgi:3,4-dihydroxy 2-butanone 4-phosphate synthase/GTP cyclohydrolase II
VLERAGHTEAAVDLATLAGLHASGVLCEVVNDDGSMARLPELIEFKQRFGLKMISIAQLIEYRHRREQLVERILERPFSSEFGEFRLHAFRGRLDGRQHVALSMGELNAEPTLVRVHSGNLLGDVFRARDEESHHSLYHALEHIASAGRGVVLYMEPTPLMREAQWKAERPSEHPASAEFRDYGIGAQILVALGLRRIRLLSGTTRRVVGLDGYGLEIVEQVRL